MQTYNLCFWAYPNCYKELFISSLQIKLFNVNIKNYTSTVDASRSMQKIEEMLVEIGASNINKKYENKICTGITFLYLDSAFQSTIAFHLKAQVEEVFKILYAEVKRPRPDTKKIILAQANRTAWKVLADWTEIQCTMILLGQAKPLQMFLPFVYDTKTEETFFDKIQNGKIDLKLLN